MWKQKGNKAALDGTQMHRNCELVCNGMNPEADLTASSAKEMSMFVEWMCNFEPENEWYPFRTEWAIWYEHENGNFSRRNTGPAHEK